MWWLIPIFIVVVLVILWLVGAFDSAPPKPTVPVVTNQPTAVIAAPVTTPSGTTVVKPVAVVTTPVVTNVPVGYPSVRPADKKALKWVNYPAVSRLPANVAAKSTGTNYKYIGDATSAGDCATKLQAGGWGAAFTWFNDKDTKYPKQCYALSNFNNPVIADPEAITSAWSYA